MSLELQARYTLSATWSNNPNVLTTQVSSKLYFNAGQGTDSSICSYKVTKGLLDRFGEKRVIDSPITESGFAGLTVGAALAGLHPVVCLVFRPVPRKYTLTSLSV